MDSQTKAKINKLVKQIKKSRKEGKKETDPSKLEHQLTYKGEKVLIALGAAAGLSIFFDDAKKRRKNPKKARKFYQRLIDNYKKVDAHLDSTVAKRLKIESEREFEDEKLEKMKVENAYKFEI